MKFGVLAILLASAVNVATGAFADSPSTPGSPVDQSILDKINEILTKLNGGDLAGNHTLRGDTNKPAGPRFSTAFPGAVLDKNTGLVWEQAPHATQQRTWNASTSYCLNKSVGGTFGWRLPSVIELKSV